MTPTTVVNITKRGLLPGEVYVGRRNSRHHLPSSPFANPYHIGRDGSREDVLTKYRAWLLDQPGLIAMLPDVIQGKTLACWCAPAACHGHVLAVYADTGCKACGQPIWEHWYEGSGHWEAGEDWSGHVFMLPGEET